jgi:L-ascorbate metabolism protein UlaG (beta-lactamase superfamily)
MTGDRLGIRFLGHSTVLVEIDGLRVLTDPVLRSRVGPLRRQHPVPDIGGLAIDAVLISHLHHDHLDLPSLRSLAGEPLLVVPAGAADYLRRRGFDAIQEMRPGETVALGALELAATRAVHGGARMPIGPAALALGYVITGSSGTIYFAGDTDLFPGMADLGQVDVALVPVWGWGPRLGPGHLDPERAARAVALIRPRYAVPIHWGTLWPLGMARVRAHRRQEPPVEFEAAVRRLAPRVTVLRTAPGETVALPGGRP